MNDIDRKTVTKEALVNSACALFTRKGYSAVSTREIADEAQVNLGAIQYHFGSKAQLFVEAVCSMMSQKKCHIDEFCCGDGELHAEEAATALVHFICAAVKSMCHPEGPDVCRVMHREIYGAVSEDPELYEPLVSSVTDQFIRPLDLYLCSLLRKLRPQSSQREIWMSAHSVIGQCAYYVTHRPFAERLRGEDFGRKEVMLEVGCHIAAFTLRGLGVESAVIERALAEASELKSADRVHEGCGSRRC